MDVKSRSATNQAALAVVVEQRNKAKLAIERAQGIIDSLVVKAPFDGIVAVERKPRCRRRIFLRPGAAGVPPGGHDLVGARHRRRHRDRQDGSAGEDQRDRPRQPAVRSARDGGIGRAAGPDLHRKGGRAQRSRVARQLVRNLRGQAVRRDVHVRQARSALLAGSSVAPGDRRPRGRRRAAGAAPVRLREERQDVRLSQGRRSLRAARHQGHQQHRSARGRDGRQRRGRDRADRPRNRGEAVEVHVDLAPAGVGVRSDE